MGSMGYEYAAPAGAAPPQHLLPHNLPQQQYDASRPRTESRTLSLQRKPIPGSGAAQQSPIPSFHIGEHDDTVAGGRDYRHSGSSKSVASGDPSQTASQGTADRGGNVDGDSVNSLPLRQLNISNPPYNARHPQASGMGEANLQDEADRSSAYQASDEYQYQRQTSYYQNALTPPPASVPPRDTVQAPGSDSSRTDNSDPRYAVNFGPDVPLQVPRTTHARPSSAYPLGSDLQPGRRTHSPRISVGSGSPRTSPSPISYTRNLGGSRRSPETRPISYLDLLNLPYNQQIAPTVHLGNTALRSAVGQNASLLDTKKTLDMYRNNIKKTEDQAVKYEFALYMVTIARDVLASDPDLVDSHGFVPAEILREARQILQKLADQGYPFAQYYLADGYSSGLFNNDKPDHDRSFPLFIAASKHGHAESGYRTALCYEFGWGCRKDYAKAVLFYRTAAARGHPGAAARLGVACLNDDMGLTKSYKEGIKWLKRATENADYQYNDAPYNLGVLHEKGDGQDIFKDEKYAVQLYTQAAGLGNPHAALKLGAAYEHGLLTCPKDAALSVHYYNCAAQAEIPEAMMNLCAWYMVGAEPVLDKDENEAYEWAKKAAELGLPKAEYAAGYFTEMGIGCRRDPLEANVWYVKAAEHGEPRAKQRLAIIQAAASGQSYVSLSSANGSRDRLTKGGKEKEANCLVM